MTRNDVTKICHEVNRAYCEAMGDYSQPAWEDAPDWQKQSVRTGVDLHMDTDVGPEASHVSWCDEKINSGWKWGPIKDQELKQHPCLVPFSDLLKEDQAKDYIFRSVVLQLKPFVKRE